MWTRGSASLECLASHLATYQAGEAKKNFVGLAIRFGVYSARCKLGAKREGFSRWQ